MKIQNISSSLKSYHFLIIISLMVIFAALEILFLYRYVYQQFDILKVRPTEDGIVLERIKIEEFKELDALHEAKEKSRPIPGEIHDPFTKPAPPPPASTTPSASPQPPRR